jgi:uncharacterized phage-associated protein
MGVPQKNTERINQMTTPANLFDIAKYILGKLGRMPALKLQRLLYYCQAWHVTWTDEKLFKEPIYSRTCQGGVVIDEIKYVCEGKFEVGPGDISGAYEGLTERQLTSIDATLDYYGDKPTQWLWDLIQMEDPWKKTKDGDVISTELMEDYYGEIRLPGMRRLRQSLEEMRDAIVASGERLASIGEINTELGRGLGSEDFLDHHLVEVKLAPRLDEDKIGYVNRILDAAYDMIEFAVEISRKDGIYMSEIPDREICKSYVTRRH